MKVFYKSEFENIVMKYKGLIISDENLEKIRFDIMSTFNLTLDDFDVSFKNDGNVKVELYDISIKVIDDNKIRSIVNLISTIDNIYI